jgi:hypothetical protein
MLEYGLRFLAGGIAVSAFALRPKSFAGLFGAAPSIALATLLITLSQKGTPFAAVEGRSARVEPCVPETQILKFKHIRAGDGTPMP